MRREPEELERERESEKREVGQRERESEKREVGQREREESPKS